MAGLTKTSPKVVRVTKDEFELDDGRTFPHAIEFEDDEVPTIEEFQRIYDHWQEVISNEVMSHGKIG